MTTRCLIGVNVVFSVADAKTLIEEKETGLRTKISDITSNEWRLLQKIIVIDFSWTDGDELNLTEFLSQTNRQEFYFLNIVGMLKITY